MRTYYENSTTLKAEKEFANYLETKWECVLQKMHSHHIIDFMLTRNNIAKAWVEVKCLNTTSNAFPCRILSLSKYMKGIEYYKTTGLPFIFAVSLQDGYYFYKHNEKHGNFEIIWGGRTKDTRDKFDIEPIIKIPTVLFEEV